MFLIACLTDHCCRLMVRTKYFVIDILMEEERSRRVYHTAREMEEYRAQLERTLGYGDLGRIALGKWCAYLIDFAVWFTQFLTIVAYFIFLANTIYTLFPLRPAAIPLNHSHPIASVDDVDGGVVSNACPIKGGFYEPRTNIGVPMLNIPSINGNPAQCDSSASTTGQGQSRRRRSISSAESAVQFTRNIENQNEDSHHDKSAFIKESNAGSTAAAIAPNTTVSPNTTTTPVPPTPHFFLKSIAPSMKLLFLIPLPFFLCTSLIRELRILSPLTVVATFALFVGAFSILGFELSGKLFICSLSKFPQNLCLGVWPM